MIGNRNSLAFGYLGPCVDIYIAGRHITSEDNQPYMAAFRPKLEASLSRLKCELNFLRFEAAFQELSLEEVCCALVESEETETCNMATQLRFADWGPTTDSYVTFLVPKRGKLYLATRAHDGSNFAAAPIRPYDLMVVIESVLNRLPLT